MNQSVIDTDTGIFAQKTLIHLRLKADGALGQRFDFVEELVRYDENRMVGCRNGEGRVLELYCRCWSVAQGMVCEARGCSTFL